MSGPLEDSEDPAPDLHETDPLRAVAGLRTFRAMTTPSETPNPTPIRSVSRTLLRVLAVQIVTLIVLAILQMRYSG